MRSELNQNSTTAIYNQNSKKGTKIGTVAGLGGSAAYIYATRDGMFKKVPNMILQKHADLFMDGVQKSKVINASANKDAIIAKLKESAKVLGQKERFADIAKKASDLVEDTKARDLLNENLNKISDGAAKLIKKDKIRCIGLPIALTIGTLTAGGALIGKAIGKIIDIHNQKKATKEKIAQILEETTANIEPINIKDLEAMNEE